jgi:hypothetical protein
MRSSYLTRAVASGLRSRTGAMPPGAAPAWTASGVAAGVPGAAAEVPGTAAGGIADDVAGSLRPGGSAAEGEHPEPHALPGLPFATPLARAATGQMAAQDVAGSSAFQTSPDLFRFSPAAADAASQDTRLGAQAVGSAEPAAMVGSQPRGGEPRAARLTAPLADMEPRGFGLVSHEERVQAAPAARGPRVDPGVLARLSRPVTRVQGPPGLRSTAMPFSISQPPLSSGQPLPPTAGSDDGATAAPAYVPGVPAGAAAAQAHVPQPITATAAELPAASPLFAGPARPGQPDTPSPAALSDPLLSPGDAATPAASLAGPSSFASAGRPAGTAHSGADPSRLQAAPDPAGHVSPQLPIAFQAAAARPGRERRVHIGQIDVHVHNQPAARKGPARPLTSSPQRTSLSSPDVNRFLLRP